MIEVKRSTEAKGAISNGFLNVDSCKIEQMSYSKSSATQCIVSINDKGKENFRNVRNIIILVTYYDMQLGRKYNKVITLTLC